MSTCDIQQNAATFLQFALNMNQIVNSNIGDWNHMPSSAFEELTRITHAFDAEFRKMPAVSTRAQIERRNVAHNSGKRVLFRNSWQNVGRVLGDYSEVKIAVIS